MEIRIIEVLLYIYIYIYIYIYVCNIYIYIYIYVIYKPRLVSIFHKYTTRGQRKFATDNPEPKGQRVYRWQTSDD